MAFAPHRLWSGLAGLLCLTVWATVLWNNGLSLPDLLFPGNDTPEHMFGVSAVVNGVDTLGIDELVVESGLPATSTSVVWFGWAALFGGTSAEGLRWLTSIWFAFILGGLTLGTFQARQSNASENAPAVAWWVWPALLPLTLSWPWYAGFMNWLLAMALLIAALPSLLWNTAPSTRRLFLWSLFLLFVGHLHLFSAVLAGTLLFVHAVRTAPTIRQALVTLAILGTPVLLLQLYVSSSYTGPDVAAESLTNTAWRSPLQTLGQFGIGGPGWRYAPALALAAWGAWCSLRTGAEPWRRSLGLWSLVMLGLAIVLPHSLASWEFFCQRFTWCGLAGLILLVQPPSKTVRTALFAACLVWSAAALNWSAQLAQAWQSGPCGQLDEASEQTRDRVPPTAYRGVIAVGSCLNPGSTYDEPTLPDLAFASHLGAMVAALEGGVPIGFGFDKTVHFWIQRSGPRIPGSFQVLFKAPDILLTPGHDPATMEVAAAHAKLAQVLSVYGSPYLIADEATAAAISRWGFTSVYASDRLHRLHWQGCPLTLHVSGAQPWAWRGGWIPTSDPWHSGDYPAGTRQTPVQTVGCGPIWVEVRAPDGSPCAEADANGWQVVDTRRQNDVQCTLP